MRFHRNFYSFKRNHDKEGNMSLIIIILLCCEQTDCIHVNNEYFH